MKFICGHERTRELHAVWAENCTWSLASFFFWRLGVREQQSQEGLSRAILYNILNAEPSLVPELLPGLWREIYDLNKSELTPPSLREMRRAFETLSQIQNYRKFCFLIDGLDEYSGDHRNGIETLQSLATNPNIKVLVSSQPITACEAAFSQMKKLCLQDLTRDDISTYVRRTVGENQHIATLSKTDFFGMRNILTDLVDKSSGVFLWVILACRSVLEGFTASDDINELRRRVDELPPELEAMYHHITSKIEPRYQREAARLLRTCFDFQEAGNGIYGKLSCYGLAMIDNSELQHLDYQRAGILSGEEKHNHCCRLEGRLRNRCWGLLEITRTKKDHAEYCFCLPQNDCHDTLVDASVDFMHRSVFEFLAADGTWNLPSLSANTQQFDGNYSMFILSMRMLHPSLQTDAMQVELFFLDAISFAKRIEDDVMVGEDIGILEQFIRDVRSTSDRRRFLLPFRRSFFEVPESVRATVYILAVEVALTNFVRVYQEAISLDIRRLDHDFPLLCHALYSPNIIYSERHVEEAEYAVRS